MEIGVGDKVEVAGVGEGLLVFRVDMTSFMAYVIDARGVWYAIPFDEVKGLTKASYRTPIGVGDRVRVLETGEEGLVFYVELCAKLPYRVGNVSDGILSYSSKELKLLAKATYQSVEG